jgi:hypothetical protein
MGQAYEDTTDPQSDPFAYDALECYWTATLHSQLAVRLAMLESATR